MRRATLLPLSLLAASACGADPAPRAPAPAPPAASATARALAPLASASAPVASASAPPAPPRPCPPRPAYAPVSFVHGRSERKGKSFNVFTGAPRLATSDPELAPSLRDVQTTLDRWMDDKVSFTLGGCGDQCSVQAYCDLTRNDGEYLAFLCTGIIWARGTYDEVQHDALLFRRRGKRFEPLKAEDLARDPATELRYTLFPSEPEDVVHDSYLALRDDAFELSLKRVHVPAATVTRSYYRYADAAPHLVCDTALALPEPPREGATVEPGPLVIATHVTGDRGDDLVRGDELSAGIVTPRFIAHEPSQAAAARLLNEAAERYIAASLKPSPSGLTPTFTCRVYVSTPRLVNMICNGESAFSDFPPAGLTLALDDPPRRIGAAELLAHRPTALKEIARRCFQRYLPSRDNQGAPTLSQLPTLSAADLESFALWQTGAHFAIPFELGGERRVELCFVPNDVLGTSVEMLSLPRRK